MGLLLRAVHVQRNFMRAVHIRTPNVETAGISPLFPWELVIWQTPLLSREAAPCRARRRTGSTIAHRWRREPPVQRRFAVECRASVHSVASEDNAPDGDDEEAPVDHTQSGRFDDAPKELLACILKRHAGMLFGFVRPLRGEDLHGKAGDPDASRSSLSPLPLHPMDGAHCHSARPGAQCISDA